MMLDELRERLLAFGYDATEEDEAQLALFWERARAYILQTCALPGELPEELRDICLELAAIDLLSARLALPLEDISGGLDISSLRMGDISLSYGESCKGFAAERLADMLTRVKAVIAGFRGVQW